MSKINVSQWKEFKLTKLFDVDLSDGDNKPKQLESGDIPLVVASGDNNGIIGKFTSDTRVYPEGTITLDMFGHAFLQNHKFQAVSHGRVNMLLPKMDVSLNSLLFIVGVLNKKCSEGAYGYAKMLSQSEANAIVIKLPVISSGQPNWHYMDEYIAKLATQAHTNISLLRQQQKKAPTVNIDRWKEFKLPELFTVSSGTKFDKRRVILTPEPHNINFIGRTGSLNGINAKCGTYKNTEPFSAGLLTVALGGTIGACFVQDKPFYTSQNVDVLIPLKCYVSKMTWNVKQFIASCIFYESQNNYLTFVRELNKHIKRDFVIKLPVDSTGQPDWQYMDNYISSIQQAQKKRVARLTSIIK